MIDPYTVLGVSRDAYKREIQARYETLRNIWDPSKQPDPVLKRQAEVELAKIEEAYAILMDPKSRVAVHYENDGSSVPAKTQPVVPMKTTPAPVPQTPSPPQAQPVPLPTPIQPQVIKPTFAQRNWWLFLIVALILGGLYYNLYNVMLSVAADRDARIQKINAYIGKTNELNDQISTQQGEIDTLHQENSGLKEMYLSTFSDLNNMTAKYDDLKSEVFCDQTIDKSLPINQSLKALVDSFRNVTNSYVTDEQIFTNNVYSMSRFRVWYGGGYHYQFFYYTDATVKDRNLISNVFWANFGCWIK